MHTFLPGRWTPVQRQFCTYAAWRCQLADISGLKRWHAPCGVVKSVVVLGAVWQGKVEENFVVPKFTSMPIQILSIYHNNKPTWYSHLILCTFSDILNLTEWSQSNITILIVAMLHLLKCRRYMLYLGFPCELIISIHNMIIYKKYQRSELFSPVELTPIAEGLKRQSDMGRYSAHSSNCSILILKKIRIIRRNLLLALNNNADCQETLTK